jgi:endonuclease-8
MLMSGSWHIYRPGERWRKTSYHMRVVIRTSTFVAVAFDVPVAEFHTAKSLTRRQGFNQLGPDVLSTDFDEAEAASRLESHPTLEIGVALLNQSILAGLGNVFKNEVCFVAGVNPFIRIGALSRTQLESIVSIAKKLLTAGMREDLWVYRRNGEPCRKCRAPILSRKQGFDARTSFWCPFCQP